MHAAEDGNADGDCLLHRRLSVFLGSDAPLARVDAATIYSKKWVTMRIVIAHGGVG